MKGSVWNLFKIIIWFWTVTLAIRETCFSYKACLAGSWRSGKAKAQQWKWCVRNACSKFYNKKMCCWFYLTSIPGWDKNCVVLRHNFGAYGPPGETKLEVLFWENWSKIRKLLIFCIILNNWVKFDIIKWQQL